MRGGGLVGVSVVKSFCILFLLGVKISGTFTKREALPQESYEKSSLKLSWESRFGVTSYVSTVGLMLSGPLSQSGP